MLIHHDFSRPFGAVRLPAARRRVAVRPWDFGPYPPHWVQVVADQYDELWVGSEWGRECAERAGLAADRIRVVPLGIDPKTLTPDGPRHPLTEGVAHTFLFVGAAIDRKGIDIVLRAFAEAFTADDPVQLVVKDHTADVFYRGISRSADVLAAANRPDVARIHYLDAYLAPDELAALYRGAAALVHPARAENWALPVLEAMACGTPVVVPRFGPFLDYCKPSSAHFVEVRRIRAPVRRDFAINTLGFREHVESIDFCEPRVESVVDALRSVAALDGDAVAARRRAARTTAERWTWDASVRAAGAAIRALSA